MRFSVDGQAREDAPAFGDLDDALGHDLVRLGLAEVLAVEPDLAVPWPDEPADRVERRALARAVAADQRDDLALHDVERDPAKGVDAAVEGVDVLDRQDRGVRQRARPQLIGDGGTGRLGLGRAIAAEIRLDDARILLDLLRRPFGDLLPVVQDRDLLRDPHDHAHLVLDEQDRDARARSRSLRKKSVMPWDSDGFMPAVGSSSSSRRGLLARARATSSRRWSPYGSLTARWSPRPLRPTNSRRRSASASRVGLFATLCPGPHDRAQPRRVEVVVLADEDVLEGGHAPEQADVLVGPRDPVVGDLVRAQVVDRVAGEGDRPLVHVEEPGQAVEERGLAGSVRPDDARDRAFLEFEVELADRGEAAESLGDLVGLQEDHADDPSSPSVPLTSSGASNWDSSISSNSSAVCSSRRATRDGRRPSGR